MAYSFSCPTLQYLITKTITALPAMASAVPSIYGAV
eukprot:IDg5719t1